MNTFNPEEQGSWEALLISNFTLYQDIDPEGYREIIRYVLIPGYKLLKPEDFDDIIESLEEGDCVVTALEKKSVKNFAEEYERIKEVQLPDKNKDDYLKVLLLKARSVAGFRSGHGKYHFAILYQIPFNILINLKPKGADFDDCFASMAQEAYDKLTQKEGINRSLLILSSILPVVYDEVPDSLTYKEVIQRFVDSENNAENLNAERPILELLIAKHFNNDAEYFEFIIKFMKLYMPPLNEDRDLCKNDTFDNIVLYAYIKRFDRIYPTFKPKSCDYALQKTSNTISNNTSRAWTVINYAVKFGLVEILDFPLLLQEDENYILAAPNLSKIYYLRTYGSVKGSFKLQYSYFVNSFAAFVRKGQIKAADFMYNNMDYRPQNLLVDAILATHPCENFDYLLEIYANSQAMITNLVKQANEMVLDEELSAKLFDYVIKFHKGREIEMISALQSNLLTMINKSLDFKSINRVLFEDLEMFDTTALFDSVKYFLNSAFIKGKNDIMESLLDKLGVYVVAHEILSRAINSQIEFKFLIDFIQTKYPQIFSDPHILSGLIVFAAGENSEKILDFAFENTSNDVFNTAANLALSEMQLEDGRQFLTGFMNLNR